MAKETVDLLMLGFLIKKPQSGYDINKTLKGYSQYLDISVSTLYHSIKKLENRGMIEKIKEVESNRPTKNIFKVTKQGKEYFHELLKINFETQRFGMDPFNVALHFLEHVKRDEIGGYLEKRKELLENHCKEMEECMPEEKKNCILGARINYHIEAEKKWIKKAMEQMKNEK